MLLADEEVHRNCLVGEITSHYSTCVGGPYVRSVKKLEFQTLIFQAGTVQGMTLNYVRQRDP